jgi:hypothetical protein
MVAYSDNQLFFVSKIYLLYCIKFQPIRTLSTNKENNAIHHSLYLLWSSCLIAVWKLNDCFMNFSSYVSLINSVR